jgi:ABC-type transport system involved in multi-copper enzyme maturation permease subunit
MNWALWIRQTLTVVKVELHRYILAKRWLGVYLIAFAPVFLLILATMIRPAASPGIQQWSAVYAVFFQTYWLRLAIFFSSMLMFSQLFRGEMLEKTLHFYLLSPVRREVIAAGKYLAGVIAAAIIFGTCTIATNVLIYVNRPGWTAFFFEGDGMSQLIRYVTAAVLACLVYGAIFMLVGLLFRIPMIPGAVLLAWEFFYFVMPAGLQKFTVMHYLQSFLPVSVDLGAFAVVTDPTPPFVGIPVLLALAAILVWISGRVLRTTQISYSSD